MALEENTNNCGTVCTVGMFDGVHRGHQLILRRLHEVAAERGLKPVVVTFDRHPRVVLGHTDGGFRLLTTTEERLNLLARFGMSKLRNIEMVHFDRATAELSACEFYARVLKKGLNAKMLLLGYDNMFGNKQRNDLDQLLQTPGLDALHCNSLSYKGFEISSTQIRNRLAAGDIEAANAMLGYCYSVQGHVEHGQAIGRTLGFPTANVSVADPLKAMPLEGVYAVMAYDCHGGEYQGVANWGAKPTVGDADNCLEVHLLDFDGDLYGQPLRVEFCHRLRDIVGFGSTTQLGRQIADDINRTKELLRQ